VGVFKRKPPLPHFVVEREKYIGINMSETKHNIVIYPGSFDPITHGHIDLISRAAKIFDHVIVAIAKSSKKVPVFVLNKRIKLAKAVLAEYPNVEVCGFDILLTKFAKQKQANLILRGLRAVSDFDYEFQLTWMNQRIAPELETIFLTPAAKYAYISSTLVKEIASLGGDVSQFTPPLVVKALEQHYGVAGE